MANEVGSKRSRSESLVADSWLVDYKRPKIDEKLKAKIIEHNRLIEWLGKTFDYTASPPDAQEAERVEQVVNINPSSPPANQGSEDQTIDAELPFLTNKSSKGLQWVLAKSKESLDKVVQEFTQITDDRYPRIQQCLALINYFRGDYQTAIEHLNNAIKNASNLDRYFEAEFQCNLGLCYYKIGDNRAALDSFGKALPFFKENTQFREMFKKVIESSETSEDISRLEKMLNYQECDLITNFLGDYYLRKKMYDTAYNYFIKVPESSEFYQSSQYISGNIGLKLNCPADLVIPHFKKVESTNKWYSDAQYRLGLFYLELNQDQEALECFTMVPQEHRYSEESQKHKATILHRMNQPAYHELVLSYINSKDYDKAQECISRMNNGHPLKTDATNRLRVAIFEKGS
jgi:tetratricopeptide (TPR) repeat protein